MPPNRWVFDADAACLDGHFPGRPVVPGVAVLDAAISRFALTGPLRIIQAKFLKPCLPGMPLDFFLAEREDGGFELRIEHQGDVMATARLGRMAVDR